MLRVCIASIQTVERSLLLLVVSASDIPLRTIKFFSVLFSSAYSLMLQAVTNKHSLVSRRLCDLHCMVIGNSFCHFVVRTSSNRSIVVRGRLCHILSFVVGNVFGTLRTYCNLRQPAIRPESRFLPIPHLHSTPPLGGSRQNITTPFGMEKREWRGYPTVSKFRRYLYSF